MDAVARVLIRNFQMALPVESKIETIQKHQWEQNGTKYPEAKMSGSPNIKTHHQYCHAVGFSSNIKQS